MLWIKNLDHNFCNLKGILSSISNFWVFEMITAAISKEVEIWLRQFH